MHLKANEEFEENSIYIFPIDFITVLVDGDKIKIEEYIKKYGKEFAVIKNIGLEEEGDKDDKRK